jgi:hypothetical protein
MKFYVLLYLHILHLHICLCQSVGGLDTFIKADTQSVVICCLSPTPTDTEHIISTLNTGCKICGLEQFISETKLPGIEDGALSHSAVVCLYSTNGFCCCC